MKSPEVQPSHIPRQNEQQLSCSCLRLPQHLRATDIKCYLVNHNVLRVCAGRTAFPLCQAFKSLRSPALPSTVIYPSPESAEIKTRATSLPAAAFRAAPVSVSLDDEVTVAPILLAFVLMAESGSKLIVSDQTLRPESERITHQSNMESSQCLGTLQSAYAELKIARHTRAPANCKNSVITTTISTA